jgi:hypothetical protein
MRRVDRWRAADQRVGGVLWATIWWVGVPIFALVMLYFASQDIGGAWRASRGSGAPGTLTTSAVRCGRYHCGASGTFVSDSGTIVVPNAFLDEAGAHPHVGQVYRVRYERGRQPPVVYAAKGSHEWIIILGFLIVAPLLLIGWAISVFARLTHRFIWAPLPD